MKKMLVLVVSVLISSSVLACEKPANKPIFPDINTAVPAQMIKTHGEVKAYVKEMEEYLNCAPLSASEKDKQLEEVKKYAAEFNELVKAYKNKNGG